MLTQLLSALPRFFETGEWGRQPVVYAVNHARKIKSESYPIVVETEGGTYLLEKLQELGGDVHMELQLLDLTVAPDVLALIIVAEGWSTEQLPNGTDQTFDILYFQGVTRAGESNTLITYRNSAMSTKFDPLKGTLRVCLEVILEAPIRDFMQVRQWLAATAASRVSRHLSEWNQGARPGHAPPFIAMQCDNQESFFAAKLSELTAGAITSVCWEVSDDGNLLPGQLREPMHEMVIGDSEVNTSLCVSAARHLATTSWSDFISHVRDGSLLPIDPFVVHRFPGSVLGRFAADQIESAEEIMREWSPYAGEAGANRALNIFRAARWID
ncbi:hypothetical protein [Streptomyces malaysiensis]|uniref:hypothetical protein n=1 Tax=Streptomyces malaysiensis TaxID=92644 RepID=UPI0024C0A0B8|nr:hypothetical protein [Streptomyces sp. NA07423]MCC4319132.1 hypothetical protein [Streptomyces malaysiensis]WHX16729.1 hypothetical protein QFW82_06625 [Streptomyces sp. NA07423]